mmetsp:Transcript_119008/g.384278  ORF Transcript_119008/g.384278 Transcript_119008/m.384278 type:complete len:212 (-) Transcript_119008:30-665(-)
MQDAVRHDEQSTEEGGREEHLAHHAEEDDCGDGTQGHPPLRLPQGHAGNVDLPIGVIVFLQEGHPHEREHANDDQALGIHDNRRDHLDEEDDCVVDLVVGEVHLQPALDVALWLREPQELAPRPDFREVVPVLLLVGLERLLDLLHVIHWWFLAVHLALHALRQRRRGTSAGVRRQSHALSWRRRHRPGGALPASGPPPPAPHSAAVPRGP